MSPFIRRNLWLFIICFVTLPISAADEERIPGTLNGQRGLKAVPIMARQSMPFPILGVGVDVDGTVYVTETQRQMREEISLIQSGRVKVQSRFLQEQCMGLTSTQSKRQFIEAYFSSEMAKRQSILDFDKDGDIDKDDLRVRSEKIYTLQDADDDGVYDQATLFADGFNSIITGVAHSVAPINGDVYATIIPDLWKLTDTNGDGKADHRESVAHGFAPHIGYGNHDLHSVIQGYDGKLYWSMGDRGANVVSKDGRTVRNPHSGCILRSNPDGTELELFAYGLRNCQYIDFDDYGNLFSIDHDADFQGESERLVYLPEGSDSGWRMYYQYRQDTGLTNATRPDMYNPWLNEKMWIPFHKGQPSHILPPIENSWNAPAAFSFQPGAALGGKYSGHFLVGLKGEIRAFRMVADGASFKREGNEVVVGALGSQVLTSTIGPDGRMYFTLWRPAGERSQLWALQGEANSQTKDVNELLAGRIKLQSVEELLRLLAHSDRRIRQQAQFELVERRQVEVLEELVVDRQAKLLPRLHCLWALGQLEHKDTKLLADLCADGNAEIRAQTARWSGDLRFDPNNLIPTLLKDESPRVRMHAAIACGNLRSKDAFESLCALLEEANDEQPVLRHAGVIGLAGTTTASELQQLAKHPSEAVRIAAVSALRRKGATQQLTIFLQDESSQIRSDAFRAIYDEAVPDTFSKHPEILQQLSLQLGANQPTPVNVRAIAANRRLGTESAAKRIVELLKSPQIDSTIQLEALYALQTWQDRLMLDPVDGRYFPLNEGRRAALRNAIGANLWTLTGSKDDKVSQLAITLLKRIQPTAEEKERANRYVLDENQQESIRVGWLDWLQHSDREMFAATGVKLLSSDSPLVRANAAARLRKASLADEAVESYLLQTLKQSRHPQELQRAIELVPTMSSKVSIVHQLLDELANGEILPEVKLEVLAVAAICAGLDSNIDNKLKAYQAKLASGDLLDRYSAALHGGDPRVGGQLFWFNTELQCSKCHALKATDKQVGPSLEGIGKQQDRKYLLQSIIDPTAKIVAGYGTVNILLTDGNTIQGVLAAESETEVKLRLPDSSTKVIARSDIATQTKPTTAMPDPKSILNLRQVRDLVAYLKTL